MSTTCKKLVFTDEVFKADLKIQLSTYTLLCTPLNEWNVRIYLWQMHPAMVVLYAPSSKKFSWHMNKEEHLNVKEGALRSCAIRREKREQLLKTRFFNTAHATIMS